MNTRRIQMRIGSTSSLLVLVVSLSALGCSAGSSVQGLVTFNGVPLKHGTVMMTGPDGIAHYGTIQSDGNYRIVNVPTATVRIAVNSPDPNNQQPPGKQRPLGFAEEPTKKAPSKPKQEGWFPIPAHFGDLLKSGLTYEVQPGENHYDINLAGQVEQPSNGRRRR